MDEMDTTSAVSLRAYDAVTGVLAWTANPDNQFFFDAPPVAYRGIVYVYGSGTGGTLYAYDEAHGALLWRQNTEGSEGSPAVSDDGVFISDGCQQVYAFARVTGASLWRHVGSCTGGDSTTPVLSGKTLYVRDFMGNLELDTMTGAGSASFSSGVAPAFDGSQGFTVSGGTLRGGDATLSGAAWAFAGDGRLATSPFVANGFVYVGSTTGNLFAVRETDGTAVWSENTGVPLASQEGFATEPRIGFAAAGGILVVPVGSTLVAYATASSVDAGAVDGGAEAGCTWGLRAVSPLPVTGEIPSSLAVADLDGDGRLDLAVSNSYVGTVNAFLGHGDGTFGPGGPEVPTGSGADSVAIGDFNGDGKGDLAVANTYSGYHGPYTVSVLLGRGDGTFQPQVGYATGTDPSSVVVGDFNRDGKPDLAVAAEGLSVLLGVGDGTFLPAVDYPIGIGAASLAIGDVNADGRADIVVANDTARNVGVLLGNGDGTFSTQVTYATGTLSAAAAIGDVNGDGKPDLAVANSGDDTVGVLLGNGDGTFRAQVTFATGLRPASVVVADLDGDGHADLAVSNSSAATISVLLGHGDGTFAPQFVVGTGAAPGVLATADLNGDGQPDLAVVDDNANMVSVFLGGCGGDR